MQADIISMYYTQQSRSKSTITSPYPRAVSLYLQLQQPEQQEIPEAAGLRPSYARPKNTSAAGGGGGTETLTSQNLVVAVQPLRLGAAPSPPPPPIPICAAFHVLSELI